MVKQIEIEIKNAIFIADLFEEKAPKSCKAFLQSLPLEGKASHQIWSGQSLIFFSPILRKAIEEQGLWPTTLFPDFKENASIIGCPGELALYPIGGSLCIAYGKALYGGGIGPEPSYCFAKITKDLDELYKIGITFRKEGEQKITIRLMK